MACPWNTRQAPDAMAALADDLGAYLAARNRLPTDLGELDRSGLGSGGHAAHAYAYHPAGLGILREGWRVVAVDDRRREEGPEPRRRERDDVALRAHDGRLGEGEPLHVVGRPPERATARVGDALEPRLVVGDRCRHRPVPLAPPRRSCAR